MNVTLVDWNWTEWRIKAILSTLTDFVSCSSFVSRLKTYTFDTVEHLILSWLLYIAICILLYSAIIQWKVLGFKREIRHVKRILFVIAHPDDEVMFFGPTILNFTKKQNCIVYLMCLSTGRNYGMGSTRKKELYKSCNKLGIKEENVIIHNHTNLPDVMDVRWPTELVANLILHQVEMYSINTLITFDRHGVSEHTNHCSIYYGVANLILDRRLPKNCAVYVLETVNVIRKYWLFLDIPLSFIMSRYRFIGDYDDRLLIHDAMKQHISQLVWFRKLYMIFSRYMLINTLQQMNLVDVELDLEIDD